MLVCDLAVGDIVTKTGDEHKYIVTSTKPIRGLPQYVSLMGPYGHVDEVWVNFIRDKVGHLEINYIFDVLNGKSDGEEIDKVEHKESKQMTTEEFNVSMIEGFGGLTGEEFECLVKYIAAKLVKQLSNTQKVQAP